MQAELEASLAELGVPRIAHTQPFFGNPSDAPRRPTRSAGLEFHIPTAAVAELPPFRGRGAQSWQQRLDARADGETSEVEVGSAAMLSEPQEAAPTTCVRHRRLHRFTPARR